MDVISQRGASSSPLAGGLGPTQDNEGVGLLQHLAKKLACEGNVEAPVEPLSKSIRFALDLSHVHLRGMGVKTPALLFAGDADASDQARRFYCDYQGKSEIPLVFCLSNASYARALEVIPKQWALVASPNDIQELLASVEAAEVLKRLLLRDIGRRRLNPYNILRPACGNIFFGRKSELAQLRDDVDHSYAIAGPGQIGKSSLLLQHRWDLVRRKDPRAARTYIIDFYNLADTSPDAVAQHIAFTMQQSKRSHELRCRELPTFLKRVAWQDNGPPELLLDEVDRFCDSPVFDMLGHEAKLGHVRLVLAGRKRLLDLMHKRQSVYEGRMKLMRVQSIDSKSAHDMVAFPIKDLGIRLREDSHVIQHVVAMSGNLPYLLQFYCQNIVEWVIRHGLDEIGTGELTEMEDGEFSLNVLGPLMEMPPDRQALALTLFMSPKRSFSIPEIRRAAVSLRQQDDLRCITDACTELLIQNILVWEKDKYWIANEALPRFARRAGLLDSVEVAPK